MKGVDKKTLKGAVKKAVNDVIKKEKKKSTVKLIESNNKIGEKKTQKAIEGEVAKAVKNVVKKAKSLIKSVNGANQSEDKDNNNARSSLISNSTTKLTSSDVLKAGFYVNKVAQKSSYSPRCCK